MPIERIQTNRVVSSSLFKELTESAGGLAFDDGLHAQEFRRLPTS